MELILTRLLLIEYATVNDGDKNHKKLTAIREIRNTLLQIDFMSEIVPLVKAKNLRRLLSSLKGKKLSKEELKLVKELIQ